MLAILSRAKQRSLTEKATINWTQIKIDWDEYIKNGAPENWRTEFTPVIRGVMTDTAEAWNAEMGIQFDVRNLFVPEVLEDEEEFFRQWFDKYLDVFSENILDTTRTDLAKLLEQADANGWGVDEMRRQLGLNFERYTTEGFSVDGMRLSDAEKAWFMERLPRYRKENIARTETMKAANAGSFELFKAWEVVEFKEWLSTNDNRTRDTHIRAGAQYVEGGNPGPIPLEQPFIVGGQQMMYPLDGSLGANVKEIAQCRCSVAPVVFEGEDIVAPIEEIAPSYTLPEFVPAKSKAEILERMSPFVRSYEFEDLPLKNQNVILRAVEQTIGKFGVQLARLGYQKRGKRSYGRAINRPGNYVVEIQKTYLKNTAKKARETRETFEKQKARNVEKFRRYVNDPEIEALREYNQEKLDHWESTTRWAIYQDADNALDAVVRHELYHVLDYQFGFSEKTTEQITEQDLWGESHKISEYAATNERERWAELGTAVDSEVNIPDELRDIFVEVISNAE